MRVYDEPIRIPANPQPIASHDLDRKLLSYASAIVAAGAYVLTTAQPVEAKVVYTKANETIDFQKQTKLDLNHDGLPDFAFGSLFEFCCTTSVLVGPIKFNKIMSYGAPLNSGVTVGVDKKFKSAPVGLELAFENFSSGITTFHGQWVGVQDKFLGLAFRINGQLHFGWARLTFSGTVFEQATLVDYAYETIPGKAIVTGQTSDDESSEDETSEAVAKPMSLPPTPGVLATGAAGLGLWR